MTSIKNKFNETAAVTLESIRLTDMTLIAILNLERSSLVIPFQKKTKTNWKVESSNSLLSKTKQKPILSFYKCWIEDTNS